MRTATPVEGYQRSQRLKQDLGGVSRLHLDPEWILDTLTIQEENWQTRYLVAEGRCLLDSVHLTCVRNLSF